MSREDTPLDRVLAALSVPAHPGELDGRDRALAAFRDAAANPLPATRRETVKKSTLAKLLTVKTGVAALCVTLLGGGVAVATGADLPVPGRSHKPASHDKAPELEHKQAPATAFPSGAPMARPTPSGSPDVRLAALCQRILRDKKNAKGRPRGRHTKGAAYAALVRAAGGEDKVLDFCRSLTLPRDKRGQKPTAKPSHTPSARPSVRPTGKPDDKPSPTNKPAHPEQSAR